MYQLFDWFTASLYKNPIVREILLSSGNIPVDRKSKDRQILFKGTFEALSKGSAVALFPEGTSYTEPKIMQVKDGAAWSALEFLRWVKDHPDQAPAEEIRVVPAAIVYTNKSKYRSSVRHSSILLLGHTNCLTGHSRVRRNLHNRHTGS